MKFVNKYLNLKSDQEAEEDTYQELLAGAMLRGTNLWIMLFAMLISCIGLNINSKAAVIGAMIISPLMGPVFAIGFAFAILDKPLIKICIGNLARIIAVNVSAATIYYLLTPRHLPTEELLSFAHPTIFDALLAFFGGLAGFIAISRADGNRVLVGVAVATACIPPLCTASYGLATLQKEYIIGGLEMYLINVLFIGIASFIATKYLGFKKRG